MIIPRLWERYNYLYDEPQCRTFANDSSHTEWNDPRGPEPTDVELGIITDAELDDNLKDKEADGKTKQKDVSSMLEVIADLTGTDPNTVKQQYKDKLKNKL